MKHIHKNFLVYPPKTKADAKRPRIRISRDENGKLVGWDDWRIKRNDSRPSANRPKKRSRKSP